MATSMDYSSCSICESRNLSKSATVWCPECEDSLCTGCKEHHSASKATRNHDTIPVEDYRKLPSFILNIQQFCEEHNEKFQMYCLNHEKPLCTKCIVRTHRDCNDTTTIDEATNKVKSSWAMESVEKRANEFIGIIKKIEDDREKNLAYIFETKNNIIKQVSSIRDQINQHLDRIQKKMLDELLSLAVKREKHVSSFLELLKVKRQKIDGIRDNLARMKMYASDFQCFLGLKEIEEKVNEDEKYLRSAFDDGRLNQVKIEYFVDEKIKNLPSICSTFGKLSMRVTASTLQLPQLGAKEAQLPKFPEPQSSIKIKLNSEHEIKIGNTLDHYSAGCCLMPNGNIIFACFLNKKIAVHGSDGSFLDEIPTKLSVIDVTLVDQKTVAATTGNCKKICFFDVDTKQEVRNIYVEKPCFGITFSDRSLIFCIKEVGLQKFDTETSKLTTIFKEDLGSWSFVTTFEDKTYFTNGKTKSIKVLDSKMKEIWQLQDKTFLQGPTGVTVDRRGLVYVVDCKKKQFVVVSSDGKQKKYLKYQADLSETYGLCYETSCSRIIVVDNKGRALFFYCSY